MKRLLLKKMVKFHPLDFLSSRKVFLPLILILAFSGFQTIAQPPQLPLVTVRFNNPQYNCPDQTYCLDVEFKCDVPGQQVYAVNLRFFYDDNILEYLSMGGFARGYDMGYAGTVTYPALGPDFGIPGPMDWFNGSVQLVDTSSVYLTSDYKKYFKICFHVDDPNSLNLQNFCPSVIWDLEENPDPNSGGGYLTGDDGITVTVVDPSGELDSSPTIEDVEQFNWQYDGIEGIPYGYMNGINCVSTICAYIIPLSNWSLFLAIGLMLIASLFIWRKRMNS